MSKLAKLLLFLLLLLGLPRPARAHDVDTSTVNFWVRNTGMDCEVYLAIGAADMLIRINGRPVALSEENFPDYSERLRAVAPSLLTVTGGNAQILAPESYSVALTEENDIIFHLHYPLPSQLPGPLLVHCAYLEKMTDTHQGMVFVNAASISGDRYGYGEVTADSPDLAAKLPAADALPHPRAATAQTQPATTTAATIPSISVTAAAPPPTQMSWLSWALLALGGFVIALTALRGKKQLR